MDDSPSRASLVAACGLYCGACRRYRKGDCPGCRKNKKASWCGVRACCQEKGYASCADCTQTGLADCKKFNHWVGKVFSLLFRSDRAGCVRRIREAGYERFAREMDAAGSQNRPVS